MKQMIKEWFTYQEVLDYSNWRPGYPHSPHFIDNWFSKVMEEFDLEIAVYTLSEFFTDSLITNIINALMTIVYERHSEDYMFNRIIPYDEDNNLTDDEIRKALSPIINVINLTLPRYIPLLQQNEYASTDPIAPVSSVSKNKTRFNDTPQDGGDFNNDPHATNVSESENETSVDSASLMERLDQLFKNFRSIILEWSNEFNQLFFKEEQIV